MSGYGPVPVQLLLCIFWGHGNQLLKSGVYNLMITWNVPLYVIGPKYQCKIAPLYMHDKPLLLQWVGSAVKYLWVTLMPSKNISLNQMRRKFFGCVNSIFNQTGSMSDMVKLHLAESYCYHALEYFNFTSTHMQQLSACWNSVYSMIFHYKPWTSVRELIYCLGRLNFECAPMSR